MESQWNQQDYWVDGKWGEIGERGKGVSQMLAWAVGVPLTKTGHREGTVDIVSHGELIDATQSCLQGHISLCAGSKAAADLTGHLTPSHRSARKGPRWSVMGQARPIICQALIGPATLSMQPSA